MSWESYVERYPKVFFDILEALVSFASFILLPIKDWINPVDGSLIDQALELFGDFSLIEFVIGGGIIVFLSITIIKWIIGIFT